MPFMPCKHADCNETVQVPNKYCYKHTPKKAKELSVKLDEFVSTQVEEVNTLKQKSNKTKKTTK